MKEENKIFTSKDLAYLSDIFNWNLIANQKIDFFLKNTTDEQVIELFTNISNMHNEFCEKIINILKKWENKNG